MADDVKDDLEERRKRLRASSRRLHGAEPEADYVELERVAAWCKKHHIEADAYGDGEGLQTFEARVAEMFGYPAARFMPSGTMAQQAALRVWSERTGLGLIGMHPTCHLELHEERGYERLHRLSAVLVGEAQRPMVTADLAAAAETLSSLIIELPTRENGGQLAPWDELVELCESARDRGIATHLDGARLWEAAAGYERPLDEICELFDSTYVSFYKGIGALPGSMLAGPVDFIEETKLWQRRHGGNLYTQMANWVSADMRLDAQIAKMAAYRDRAKELGAALAEIGGVTVNPAVPQVNMFHVFMEGLEDALLLARDRVAEDHGLWLFGALQTTEIPNTHKFEVAVGGAAMAVDLSEVVASFESLVS